MAVEIDTNGVAIYHSDGEEIVSWTTDEMEEDPECVAFAIAGSIKTYYTQGEYALMLRINHPRIRNKNGE